MISIVFSWWEVSGFLYTEQTDVGHGLAENRAVDSGATFK